VRIIYILKKTRFRQEKQDFFADQSKDGEQRIKKQRDKETRDKGQGTKKKEKRDKK